MQMLGVTCDNASNNDTMVDEMARRIAVFEGTFSRVRCFAHVVNLVVKSLLRQFDVRETKDADGLVDEDVRALLELAQGMADEDVETLRDRRAEEHGVEDAENDEEWVDEIATLDDWERDEFEEQVRPIKMVTVKVSVCTVGSCRSADKNLPVGTDP